MYDMQSRQVVTEQVGTTNGQVQNVARVKHQIASQSKLKIKITNGTGNDITDLPIFPGYQAMTDFTAKSAADSGQSSLVYTFNNFASIAEYVRYFTTVKCLIEGGKYSTSDTDNLVGSFNHIKTYPAGEKKTAEFDIENFRVNLGSSYQKEGRFKAEALVWALTPSLQVKLSKLKAGTSIEFEFNITGFEDHAEVGAIDAREIR